MMFPIDRDFSAIGESLTTPKLDSAISTSPSSPAILETAFPLPEGPKVIAFEQLQIKDLSTPMLIIQTDAFEAQIFRLVIREVVQELNEAKQVANAIINFTIQHKIERVEDLLDTLEDVGIDFREHLSELRKGICCYTELVSRFEETLAEATRTNPKKVRFLASQIISRHVDLQEVTYEPNLLEKGVDFLFGLATKIVPMERIVQAIHTQAKRENNSRENNPYKVHVVRFLGQISFGKFDSFTPD